MSRLAAVLLLLLAAGCSRGPTLQDLDAASAIADRERATLQRYEDAHKVIVTNVAEALVDEHTPADKKAEYQRIEQESAAKVAAQREKWEQAAARASKIEKSLE